MLNSACEFYLPLGLKDRKGTIHRKGIMNAVTAEDELMLQESDAVRFNDRQRDLELLARLIPTLGTLAEVTADTMEDLYEPDFIYLQMLFNSQNEGGNLSYRCPRCGTPRELNLPTLFQETNSAADRESCNFRLPHGSGLKPEMGTKVRGVMQMARCRDFISLYRDPRTRENPSWFYVGLLTKSIKKLGSEKSVNNGVITKLSPPDFTFLVDLFNELNNGIIKKIETICPCGSETSVELQLPGEV